MYWLNVYTCICIWDGMGKTPVPSYNAQHTIINIGTDFIQSCHLVFAIISPCYCQIILHFMILTGTAICFLICNFLKLATSLINMTNANYVHYIMIVVDCIIYNLHVNMWQGSLTQLGYHTVIITLFWCVTQISGIHLFQSIQCTIRQESGTKST